MSTEIDVIDGEIVTGTTLPELAVLANRYHAAAENSVQGAVESAWHAGHALAAAKAQCEHGDWLPWLEANFIADERTAQRYMVLASNTTCVSDLDSSRSITGALKAISARKPDKPEPSQPKPRRRSITDQARTAGWELRKATDRIERIAADDRFTPQKKKVAPQLRDHLTNAIDVCQAVLDRINQEEV